MRGNKRVLRALDPPLDPALEAELLALREAAFRSDDFAEGVRAFIEKRPPPGRAHEPLKHVSPNWASNSHRAHATRRQLRRGPDRRKT